MCRIWALPLAESHPERDWRSEGAGQWLLEKLIGRLGEGVVWSWWAGPPGRPQGSMGGVAPTFLGGTCGSVGGARAGIWAEPWAGGGAAPGGVCLGPHAAPHLVLITG